MKWATCFGVTLIFCTLGMLDAAESPAWRVPSAHLRLRLELAGGSSWPASSAQCLFSAGGLPPEQTTITVTRPEGEIVPSSILWARQGQPMTLVFETVSGASNYYVYVEAGSTAGVNPWRPQAGVMLETRTLDRPAFDSRSQFETAWNSATGTYGRSFKTAIFEGLHPHGPPENFLARYEAWFQVDQAGEYAFATLSDDASFLSVDSKPVAEWPGIHSTVGGRYGEKKGRLHLDPGLHRLRYDLAQSGGLLAAVASWQPPGKPYFEVMPERAFPPVAWFVCRGAESTSGPPFPAHFVWRLTRSATLDQALLATVTFRAMPVPDANYAWSFGDGATAEGEVVEHAFIGPGKRQVRLEIRPDTGKPYALEQSVEVHPAWWQLEECPDSILFPLRNEVRLRNPKSLSLPELETVATFASGLGDGVWLDEAGSECLRRKTGFSAGFGPVLYSIGLTFRHPQFRKYAEADTLFSLALGRLNGPETNSWHARIALSQAETRLNGLRNPESALAVLNTLQDDTMDDYSRRQKHLLTADALMTQGRQEEALRISRALAPSETGTLGAVHLQSRLTAAADYVRRQEWDAGAERLESIMTDYPSERFNGSAGLLLMDARTGRRSLIPALALGERLLNADQLDDTHAAILLRLSNLYKAMGDQAGANRCRERLKREFPYSEAAAVVESN